MAPEIPLEDTVIHASRVVKYVGVEPPPARRRSELWWGIPVMQRVWSRARQLLSAYGYGEAILQDISLDVFVLAGIVEAFQNGRESLVAERLRTMQLQKSVLRGIALDGGNTRDGRPGEQYIPQNRSVSGIRELIELFLQAFQSATGIPRSVLLGETSGGLNTGTNSGEIRTFYARLGSEQRNKLTPWVNFMLDVILSAKDGPTGGRRPPSWTVKWKPLWTPTEQEEADTRLKRAQGDRIYFDMGVVLPEEIRETRMVMGSTGELEATAQAEFDAMLEEPEPEPVVEVGGDQEGEPEDEGAELPDVDVEEDDAE